MSRLDYEITNFLDSHDYTHFLEFLIAFQNEIARELPYVRRSTQISRSSELVGSQSDMIGFVEESGFVKVIQDNPQRIIQAYLNLVIKVIDGLFLIKGIGSEINEVNTLSFTRSVGGGVSGGYSRENVLFLVSRFISNVVVKVLLVDLQRLTLLLIRTRKRL